MTKIRRRFSTEAERSSLFSCVCRDPPWIRERNNLQLIPAKTRIRDEYVLSSYTRVHTRTHTHAEKPLVNFPRIMRWRSLDKNYLARETWQRHRLCNESDRIRATTFRLFKKRRRFKTSLTARLIDNWTDNWVVSIERHFPQHRLVHRIVTKVSNNEWEFYWYALVFFFFLLSTPFSALLDAIEIRNWKIEIFCNSCEKTIVWKRI